MSAKSSPTRYGSVAIALHWIAALMIVAVLASGALAAGQTDEAAQIALLRAHVPLGIGVLILTLLRLVWWLVADPHRPASPQGQPRWQAITAKAVHLGLYAVVLIAAASGLATLLMSGALPAIVAGTTLPDFDTVLPRMTHGVVARLTLVLLALHVGAALYHHFIRRDGLLGRMGLGQGG